MTCNRTPIHEETEPPVQELGCSERCARKTSLKRLAIQVEDHALEFGPFQEMNPEGEYGTGRIKVWDHGTYELEKWTADRIAFTLHGSRVSGRFSLVRFKEGEPLSWFLMKRREI
jgi:DNA ligase D-like protein (predicted 3'-phosphoesterase)